MTTDALVLVLVAHWVADFICQTRWMADNKSKSWSALTQHVGVYGVVMLGVATFILPSPPLVAWWAINVVAHFVTDAVTSRITSRLAARRSWYWFFAVVGLDQLIHTLTLILAWEWLT